ncbi:MAG: TIGR00366 family protein [Alphaproteobacteria bacterium]|nr:TIGR00366 family protein [Alphaproteobacteria bacterium]
MTTVNTAPGAGHSGPARDSDESAAARLGLRFTVWAERWFPDAYVFVVLAVAVVAAAALLNGAPAGEVARAFGDGFWGLIVFTMQMAMIVIGGYVVASSPPVARLIEWLATLPRSGRGAVAFVAALSMLSSFLHWGLSLIFSGLLVRALGRRSDLRMDYRAAGAAGSLGLGATWALGLSSSAAQLQANAASMPKALLDITGVIPFTQTVFLWQSLVIFAVLVVVSVVLSQLSAPSDRKALTAQAIGADTDVAVERCDPPARPGDWLEYNPIMTIIVAALAGYWIWQEFASKPAILVISNLNTYNFIFLTLGVVLHWRPRSFLNSVAKAVPATTGVLVQFPFYAAISNMLTAAKGSGGLTLAEQLSHAFVNLNTSATFPVTMGIYSAVLGFFVPSGGGKWLIEAPYVMKAANDLQVHLGWAVQVYNAAEALPNLINPFWMLPLLAVLGLKARDIVGYTFLQFLVHVPVVLFLLWALAGTLTYTPPAVP